MLRRVQRHEKAIKDPARKRTEHGFTRFTRGGSSLKSSGNLSACPGCLRRILKDSNTPSLIVTIGKAQHGISMAADSEAQWQALLLISYQLSVPRKKGHAEPKLPERRYRAEAHSSEEGCGGPPKTTRVTCVLFLSCLFAFLPSARDLPKWSMPTHDSMLDGRSPFSSSIYFVNRLPYTTPIYTLPTYAALMFLSSPYLEAAKAAGLQASVPLVPPGREASHGGGRWSSVSMVYWGRGGG